MTFFSVLVGKSNRHFKKLCLILKSYNNKNIETNLSLVY